MGMHAHALLGYGFETKATYLNEEEDLSVYDWEEIFKQKAPSKNPKDSNIEIRVMDEWGNTENIFVYIRKSAQDFYEGELTKLKKLKDNISEWETQLKSFCEIMNLEYKEPGWQVLVNYS